MSVQAMMPTTADKASNATSSASNAAIRQQTDQRVAELARAGREAIDRRLEELDREWDIERTLEANASALIVGSVALGLTVDRRFFYLSGTVASFLLQHALQGWCPPLPIFRHMGVRTSKEIAEERYALKAIRGDFQEIGAGTMDGEDTQTALAAARR